jgi:TolB-like protein
LLLPGAALAINVTPVTNCHHDDSDDAVIDGVKDSIVTDPDTKSWPAL